MNVLSSNGRPIAKVSAGERIGVSPRSRLIVGVFLCGIGSALCGVGAILNALILMGLLC